MVLTKNMSANNILKLSISICCIVIAGVVAYYYFHFLPQKSLAETQAKIKSELFQRQADCQKVGEAYVKSDANGEGLVRIMWTNQKYHYNSLLNKCLLTGDKTIALRSILHEEFPIVDVYGNNMLYEWAYAINEDGSTRTYKGNESEYYQKLKELFPE